MDTLKQRIADLRKQISVEKMYYTACNICGAQNDWSDSRKQALKNWRAHLRTHREELLKEEEQ